MLYVLDWIEHHPGLAAWVQAAGTVGALLLALLLPMISSCFRIRQYRRAAARLGELVVSAIRTAGRIVGAIDLGDEEAHKRDSLELTITSALHALDRFPAEKMQSANLWLCLVRLRGCVQNALQIAHEIQAPDVANPDPNLPQIYADALATAEALQAELKGQK